MTKKNSKKIKTANYSNGDEFGKLVKLIIIVTLIFVVFYGITFLVNKEKETDETTTSSKIQYDNILIGNLLNQPNDEYYVMIYDEDDYDNMVYETYLNLYTQKEDALRYYTSQLADTLNNSFVSDKDNFDIKDIKDLKIKTSTLIKVKKGKITEHYVGDEIKEYLQELLNEED